MAIGRTGGYFLPFSRTFESDVNRDRPLCVRVVAAGREFVLCCTRCDDDE